MSPDESSAADTAVPFTWSDSVRRTLASGTAVGGFTVTAVATVHIADRLSIAVHASNWQASVGLAVSLMAVLFVGLWSTVLLTTRIDCAVSPHTQ